VLRMYLSYTYTHILTHTDRNRDKSKDFVQKQTLCSKTNTLFKNKHFVQTLCSNTSNTNTLFKHVLSILQHTHSRAHTRSHPLASLYLSFCLRTHTHTQHEHKTYTPPAHPTTHTYTNTRTRVRKGFSRQGNRYLCRTRVLQ